MFMVGHKPTSSSPTILFSCNSKVCRQKAMELVEKTGILECYPGVLMAESSRRPKLLAPGDNLELPFLPAGIYTSGTLKRSGTFVLISSGDGRPTRKATIGGVVFVDNEMFGLTTAHAFSDTNDTNIESDGSLPRNLEFSFHGLEYPYDDSEDEADLADITSQGSRSSNSSSSHSTHDVEEDDSIKPTSDGSRTSVEQPGSEAFTGVTSSSSLEKLGSLYYSGYSNNSLDSIDWALVEVEHPSFSPFYSDGRIMASPVFWKGELVYPKSIANRSSDVPVIVCTGSNAGVVEGTLSATESFALSSKMEVVQPLWTRVMGFKSYYWRDVWSHSIRFPWNRNGLPFTLCRHFQDIQQRLRSRVGLSSRQIRDTSDVREEPILETQPEAPRRFEKSAKVLNSIKTSIRPPSWHPKRDKLPSDRFGTTSPSSQGMVLPALDSVLEKDPTGLSKSFAKVRARLFGKDKSQSHGKSSNPHVSNQAPLLEGPEHNATTSLMAPSPAASEASPVHASTCPSTRKSDVPERPEKRDKKFSLSTFNFRILIRRSTLRKPPSSEITNFSTSVILVRVPLGIQPVGAIHYPGIEYNLICQEAVERFKLVMRPILPEDLKIIETRNGVFKPIEYAFLGVEHENGGKKRFTQTCFKVFPSSFPSAVGFPCDLVVGTQSLQGHGGGVRISPGGGGGARMDGGGEGYWGGCWLMGVRLHLFEQRCSIEFNVFRGVLRVGIYGLALRS
ncbi:hypothetical protein G7Y89_g13931 [Cudoniella acicularis]|uniref:Uncharacterized protein n=1 Tax=Cudoniella acicularis TaxID=354080 RepID=A0A8H4R7L5_9HELO|nr:hypothetical protein G7Y89_g13931 [Cudoniella acicularis]